MKGYWRRSFYVFLCVGLLFSLVSCGSDDDSTNTDLLVAFVEDDVGGPGSVQRYNGTTGASLGAFVSGIPHGVDPTFGFALGPLGLAFGPDSNLYISNDFTNDVKRYNGTTGAFMSTFVSAGLDVPTGLVFGRYVSLYVSSNASGEVLRYDGETGAFMNIFVAAGKPILPAFLT